MENISLAFQLMIVGMVTVFIILLVVIQLGKGLIKLVNKLAPEETAAPQKAASRQQPAGIDARTQAVINEAVNRITGGKGRISKIQSL